MHSVHFTRPTTTTTTTNLAINVYGSDTYWYGNYYYIWCNIINKCTIDCNLTSVVVQTTCASTPAMTTSTTTYVTVTPRTVHSSEPSRSSKCVIHYDFDFFLENGITILHKVATRPLRLDYNTVDPIHAPSSFLLLRAVKLCGPK